MISVLNNSVHTKNLNIKEAVPSLPKGFYCWRNTISVVRGVKQKIDVLIKLYEYAAAIFDNDKMLISGGCYENVSKTIW